jgi:hypothetical protein
MASATRLPEKHRVWPVPLIAGVAATAPGRIDELTPPADDTPRARLARSTARPVFHVKRARRTLLWTGRQRGRKPGACPPAQCTALARRGSRCVAGCWRHAVHDPTRPRVSRETRRQPPSPFRGASLDARPPLTVTRAPRRPSGQDERTVGSVARKSGPWDTSPRGRRRSTDTSRTVRAGATFGHPAEDRLAP